jgi:hypothetical protein
MFGHQDHDDPTTTDNQTTSAPAAPEPQADATLSDTSSAAPVTTSAPAIDEDVASDYIATPHTAPTASTPTPDPVDTTDVTTDEVSAAPTVSAAAPDTNELLDLKQNALQKLSPLLGHLDQTPEEKFRTTMMMIQASDNQALLKDAYDAAQAIEDEKTRAQALLDVVNEINYFTQSSQDQQN